MKFYKYQALGNDYLVINSQDLILEALPNLKPELIQIICHRNFGIGSDGILLGFLKPEFKNETKQFSLRIFNPDGTEAEKSGNGLRIFSRYLWDMGQIKLHQPFLIKTPGGIVKSLVENDGKTVRIEMGKVSFWSQDIPVTREPKEMINQKLEVGDRKFEFCAATIGNPHCVILLPEVTPEITKNYGSLIENHVLFPKRTNVQFMKVIDRNNIQIEIWERGAGYTLASGSSSSAAAAVAYKLGLCDAEITVTMPGGKIFIQVNDDFSILMTGSIKKVATGELSEELLSFSII